MAKPIDDTEMLVTMAWDQVDGKAETATGAMRLQGVERGSGQERRLLRKWTVCGPVLLAAMRRAERMRDEAQIESFLLGREKGFADALKPPASFSFREIAPRAPSLLSRIFSWSR